MVKTNSTTTIAMVAAITAPSALLYGNVIENMARGDHTAAFACAQDFMEPWLTNTLGIVPGSVPRVKDTDRSP